MGEPGKCSALYHYYQHPRFGWMYIRLQTWFPFEVQIGLNGREWLAQRMDQEGMRCVYEKPRWFARHPRRPLGEPGKTDGRRRMKILRKKRRK